jgi:hypothetical protein
MRSIEKTLTIVNDVKIIQLENDLVPIKPICDALGIDAKAQRDKIQNDDFLNSTGVLSTSVGADKKEREMYCLPLKYIFGWLSTINPKNVKEEAKPFVIEYRKKCYDALFDVLFLQNKYLKEKEIMIEDKLKDLESIRTNFKNAKMELDEANKDLKVARTFSFDDWKTKNGQTSLDLE